MAKILIVHYSYTGTCRQIAATLSGLLNWTGAAIADANPERTQWRCVLDSLLRRRPPSGEVARDVNGTVRDLVGSAFKRQVMAGASEGAAEVRAAHARPASRAGHH